MSLADHLARRANSIALKDKPCPVDMKPHDWRYASHAPGWELGDSCAWCQRCGLRCINKPKRKEG